MFEVFKDSIKKILLSNDIDIHSKYYKSTENYAKIKNNRITASNSGSISLEEFIERYLLSEQEVMKTYESIYDMGNPYKLDDNKCEYVSVAEEIVNNMELADDVDTNEIVNNFNRSGGLLERLKTYLDIDLESFDKRNKQYKCEGCKILYLFYKLEHEDFEGTNVLKLLSKPSMENIDNLFIGMETRNGMIVKLIKDSVEKEVPLPVKNEIRDDIKNIVSTWDMILENAYMLTDFIYQNGYEYDFEETIHKLFLESENPKIKSNSNHTLSPIGTLYLKIVQHEYIGNVKDISKINDIQKDYAHIISPELIEKMKKLHYSPVDIYNVEQYISDNAKKISKYVYLGAKTSSDDVKKIYNAKGKIHKWLSFCKRAKPLLAIKDIANELQIISFLQAVILDDPNETFDYIFYGYQKYSKHMKRVQAALKNDDYVPHALQCYWTRKVTYRWYANIGRIDAINNAKKWEQACDNILEDILNKSSLDEMWETHRFYLDRLDDGLITTNEQLLAVQHFICYLKKKGFNYIDYSYIIRYAFLYPPEIYDTYKFLTEFVNIALEDCESLVQIELESSSANGKNKLIIQFELSFDYDNHNCVIQNFNRSCIS